MSSQRCFAPASRLLALLSLSMSLAGVLSAQAVPAAKAPGAGVSRFDLYTGYADFRPFSSDINNYAFETIPTNAVLSGTGYFNRFFGAQLESNLAPTARHDNSCVYTAEAGPVIRGPIGRFVPFFHALGGAAKIGGPRGQLCDTWGWGVTGGFGLDYNPHAFNNRFGLRLLQGDFLYSRIDHGPLLTAVTGGLGEIYSYRLSAGLVTRFGPDRGQNGGDTTFTCTAAPENPLPGDPVTITGNLLNLRTNKDLHFAWDSTAGKVAGAETSATVDTTGVAPGNVTVTGRITQGKKLRVIASCTATFLVRQFDPPTLSCSADKAAIHTGDPVTITSTGISPQNRPLTFSYTATNGTVTGSGATATLNTSGSTPGTITVNCSVVDDLGQIAAATASIVVTPTPPAPVAQARPLCTLAFTRDRRRPVRVDNEAKGCLDDIALTLNRESTARLLMVGHRDPDETSRQAAERTANAAEYLVKEKSIDPARLDLRTGDDLSRSVSNILLPAGVTPDAAAGTSFDRSSVRPAGQPYGGAAHSSGGSSPRHRRRRPSGGVSQPPGGPRV